MIQILHYYHRRPGDLYFVDAPGWLSRAIQDAEVELNPLSDAHYWVPSHVGVFGPNPGEVTEAQLDLEQNSAVAINHEDKYDGFFWRGQMQIWRCEASPEACAGALVLIRKALAGEPYSLSNLIGFGLEALAARLGKRIDNPLDFGFVCSQVGLAQLLVVNALSGAEAWATMQSIRDCTPDVLCIACAAHKSGEMK